VVASFPTDSKMTLPLGGRLADGVLVAGHPTYRGSGQILGRPSRCGVTTVLAILVPGH